MEIADSMVRAGCDVVAIDSTAAMAPREEVYESVNKIKMGDNYAGHGSLMSQALRKMAGPVGKIGCCLIFVNQLRHKTGVLFGNPEKTTGANALDYYSSVAIDLRVQTKIKRTGVVVGNQVRATIKKNKLAPPFRTAQIEIGW